MFDMKQNFKRAVNLTALVLAAGLLMGLLTGCPQTGNSKPQPDSLKPQTVTITVTGDDNVTVNDPKTLEAVKGTTWSAIKAAVEEKISYKTGYEAKGFKLDNESEPDLKDDDTFNTDKTVYVLSKPQESPDPEKITITVTGDDNVTVNDPKTLEAVKGTTWSAIKAAVAEKINYKEGYEAKGFKLDSESGQDLKDGYAFNENKTVFALSKKNNTTIFRTDGNGIITGYTCTQAELPAILEIPAQIEDEVITEIGENAFKGCTGVTEV